MHTEIHIAGVVVQSLPERSLEAAAAITTLLNAEVRAIDAGKLVVVCEGGSAKDAGSHRSPAHPPGRGECGAGLSARRERRQHERGDGR